MTTIRYPAKRYSDLKRDQLVQLAYALEDQRDRALRKLDDQQTAPDWADVREAARKAGWSVRTEPIGLRPVETKVWAHYPPGERFADGSRGWARVAYGRDGACELAVELHAPGRDPRSRIDLVDPTPAQVLEAARLVGLDGARS